MPKVEYPAFFDDGLIGARCKEQIEHREAFLFVPYKMLMSICKAQKHPVLDIILRQNVESFYEQNQDWEQFQLTLFIFYEMTLEQASYWYPYLR